MQATGILFIGNTRPLASTAADGTFQLTLLAMDRIAPHKVEPWRITWAGPQAQAFWEQHQAALQSGQPISVQAHGIRTFTTTGKFARTETHANVTALALAPRYTPTHSPQPHHPETQPA